MNVSTGNFNQPPFPNNYNQLDFHSKIDTLLLYFVEAKDKGLPFPWFEHSDILDEIETHDLLRYKGEKRKSIVYITQKGLQIANIGYEKYLLKIQEKKDADAAFKMMQYKLTEAQLQEIKDAYHRSNRDEEISKIANRNSKTANMIAILSVITTVIISLSTCKSN